MAADALGEGAKALGLDIRIETQGSVGAGTPLSLQEINDADLVIIAADREVDRARFAGKRIFIAGTKPAIANGKAFIQTAIKKARLQTNDNGIEQTGDHQEQEKGGSIYRHLMTGVSFMLPFVVAGGLLIALSFAIGGINAGATQDTLAYALNIIGSKAAFALMVPVLAGYIAFSIADRPGLAPGMIGGLLAQQVNAGFIGGIFAGFIAGYITLLAVRYIRLPRSLDGLMPVLILPLVGTLITGLLMFYVIGEPVAALMRFLTNWLRSLDSTNALLLGALLGAMMAIDMGGPINKAAYTFSTGLIADQVYTPIAAAMIAGMVPPMALALAALLFPSRFTEDERAQKVQLLFSAWPLSVKAPFPLPPVIHFALSPRLSLAAQQQAHSPWS